MYREDITRRAYAIWCAKGCPEDTAVADWHQAVAEFVAWTKLHHVYVHPNILRGLTR